MPDGVLCLPIRPDARAARIAGPSDAEQVLELCHALYRENGNGVSLRLSPEKLAAHVEAGCNGNCGIVGVIGDPGRQLIGTIGIFLFQPWYSDEWMLSEYWTYVRPEHRAGGRCAEALFAFASAHRKHMIERTGINFVLDISLLSEDRLAAKERYWSRRARKIGALFVIDGDPA